MENLSVDLKKALDLMLAGKNVFLTGFAGTGKSTVLNEYRARSMSNYVVVAPTGIAALNVHGQTINSFFMLPFGILTPDNVEEIPYRRKKEIIKSVDTLIVDEISMVRSDMFAAIDRRMREVASRKDKDKPFGGKQVIVCGDFFLLPPIVTCLLEEDWLNEHMHGEYAFLTDLWQECNFCTVMLKDPFRQQSDKRFMSILDHVRHGELDDDTIEVEDSKVNAIDALNKLCYCEKQMPHAPIRLCTTNREAQAVNNEARAKIDSEPVTFNAVVKGKFNEPDYPTEAVLVLKVGVRVMLLCNAKKSNGEFLYVNGDCGTVLEIKENGELSRVRIKLDNGNDVWVKCNEWKNMKYVLDVDVFSGRKIIRQEVIGSFVQMPLKLAYAITIHKSQGMTLDCVDLRLGNGCFAHGQLYTALSRTRSIDRLQLERSIFDEDLILDKRVVEFYKSIDPRCTKKKEDTVKIDILKEDEDAVREFVKKLKEKRETAKESSFEKSLMDIA